MKQASRANRAQIEQHINRQRKGLGDDDSPRKIELAATIFLLVAIFVWLGVS